MSNYPDNDILTSQYFKSLEYGEYVYDKAYDVCIDKVIYDPEFFLYEWFAQSKEWESIESQYDCVLEYPKSLVTQWGKLMARSYHLALKEMPEQTKLFHPCFLAMVDNEFESIEL